MLPSIPILRNASTYLFELTVSVSTGWCFACWKGEGVTLQHRANRRMNRARDEKRAEITKRVMRGDAEGWRLAKISLKIQEIGGHFCE